MKFEMQMFIRLAGSLLEGYAWGMAAAESEGPYSKEWLDKSARKRISAELMRDLSELNVRPANGEFIDAVDGLVNTHPYLEDLREFLMDLAVLQVIQSGTEAADDFLESPEWEKIEEGMEERGTELLNLLIYLKDSQENEAEVRLEDFLYEFLLVEDDDFQDEFFIYEPVVSNQELVDGSTAAIVEIGNDQTADMVELFTPMMLYFRKIEDRPGESVFAMLEKSRLPHVHAGIYRMLVEAGKLFAEEE